MSDQDWTPLTFLHLVFKHVLRVSPISVRFFATSMSPPNNPNEFSGHIRALLAKQPGQKPLQEDVVDDIEGEKETIPNLTEDDLQQPADQNPGPFAANWRASITSASKGVTEKTDSEYQRSVIQFALITFIDLVSPSLAKQCAAFLISHQLIKTAEEFLCPNPPNDSDVYIISWIMQEWVFFYTHSIFYC